MSHITSLGMEKNYGLAIACYLAQEGADLNHKNRKGKTPLELIQNSAVIDLLQHYAEIKK